MKRFETDKITDLADVFYAVLGGKPENVKEIDEFMEKSPLKKLLFTSDIVRILEYDGFFADETVLAVYSLLPEKIRLNQKQSVIMSPTTFMKLNRERITRPHSRLINISFPAAQEVMQNEYDLKIQRVIEALIDAKKKKYEKTHTALTKEELKREQNKLRMRKRRIDHPLERKSYYKKFATLTPEEQEKKRADNNRRNALYRAKNRERLRQKANARRANLKAENPELLKELDRKNNTRANRSEIDRRYYQKHKDEITLKAGRNPMVKVYKKRYQIKKRLQKTGPILASLVAALAVAKGHGK